MRCSCPKCDVTIEIPEQEITADGSSQRCPECKDKYWIRQEKFMLRAYKKQGRVHCFGCGHELGSEHYCVQCGSLCPDYAIVQSTKFVAQKKQKSGLNFSLARRPKSAKVIAAPKDSSVEQPQHIAGTSTDRRWLLYAGMAVLLLALTGGITKFYLDNKAEQEYSKNFIVALYGIKSGADLSLDMIENTTSGWQEAVETASIAPRTSKQDLDKLVKVKARIDQAMESLRETPEKFVESRNKLTNLYGFYEAIYSLNTTVPTSLDVFIADVDKAKKNFFRAAIDLKSTMPEVMLEELKTAVIKYKNLGFLIEGS